MEVLKERGVDHELRLQDDGKLLDTDSGRTFSADGIKIIRTYRFEGESNPDDSAVLYLLENTDGIQGTSSMPTALTAIMTAICSITSSATCR